MNILRKLVFTRINKPPVCLYSTRGNVMAPQLDMSLKTAKNAAKRIVWVDLEMTGLNVDTDHILEIACLVTDADLNVVATGPNIIINQPNSILENMHPWCINQHEWIDRGQSQFQGIT